MTTIVFLYSLHFNVSHIIYSVSSIINKIVILRFYLLSYNIQCHQFSAYSKFPDNVSVTDDDGGSANITSQQYVVVYNPSAGYVTG